MTYFRSWILLLTVGSITILPTGCFGPETKNVMDGLKCQNCLEDLFTALELFGETHKQFPLDEDGQIQLDLLSADTNKVTCPRNRDTDCYLFRSGLQPKDLDPERTGDPTIIAMDVANNHPVEDGKERVQVLMNQGFALSLLIDVGQAEKWRRRLANGDVFEIAN